MSSSLNVPQSLDGRPAITVLKRLHPGRHPSFAEKLLRQKRVLRRDQTLERGTILRGGDVLEILPRTQSPPPPQPNRRLRLDFAHRDEAIAVVRKKALVPMHPGAGHGTDTILNALVGVFGETLIALGPERGFGLVHRLDRGTSGLLVVALDGPSYDHLRGQFEERKVAKEYTALVEGLVSKKGVIDSPLDGKSAETEYVPQRTVGDSTLLKVYPKTGRMHQIRLHMAGLGHPVVGDVRYGAEPQERLGKRPFLHASCLSFVHPRREEKVTFSWPLPQDLAQFLETSG